MVDFINNNLDNMNLSLWSITSISITDIIDIFLVAYIVYKFIVWIKETRAWTLFKGIAIIMLISAVSFIFNLYTVNWIIQNTYSVGLIAIIILFQPEIRKALEQIGKGKLLSNITGIDRVVNNSPDKVIEEVILACRSMSKVRTGALIVIEQEIALGDHEKTGVLIDSVISHQLLINIFANKTPLHDGAVIIRNNRIAAASCILPLTQTEIGLELGTRHRAAVGTTEVSDAKVLIVSEETGYVSYAYGGKLYKNLSDDKLRARLLKERTVVKPKVSFRKVNKNDEEVK